MVIYWKSFLSLLNLFSIVQIAEFLPLDKNLKQSRAFKSNSFRVKYESEILSRIKKDIVLNGFCSHGRQWYYGKCITLEEYQQLINNEYEDYDEIITRVASFKDVKVTQTLTVQKEDLTDEVATDINPVYSNVSRQETDGSVEQLYSTEKTLESDTIENRTIPSTPTFVDKSMVTVERMTNLTYILLVTGSCCGLVLIWLLKLLYDCCLRKDDHAVFIPCSTDDIQDVVSS